MAAWRHPYARRLERSDSQKCSPRKAFPRDEADGSRARWCYYQGKAGNEKACILIVASPSNLNYPEPLRVWDKTVNKPRR
ncbi:MAG: DUF6807 family protein [Parabacteroides merdae]